MSYGRRNEEACEGLVNQLRDQQRRANTAAAKVEKVADDQRHIYQATIQILTGKINLLIDWVKYALSPNHYDAASFILLMLEEIELSNTELNRLELMNGSIPIDE